MGHLCGETTFAGGGDKAHLLQVFHHTLNDEFEEEPGVGQSEIGFVTGHDPLVDELFVQEAREAILGGVSGG